MEVREAQLRIRLDDLGEVVGAVGLSEVLARHVERVDHAGRVGVTARSVLPTATSDDLGAREDLGHRARAVCDDDELAVGPLQGRAVDVPLLDDLVENRVPRSEEFAVPRSEVLESGCDDVWRNGH